MIWLYLNPLVGGPGAPGNAVEEQQQQQQQQMVGCQLWGLINFGYPFKCLNNSLSYSMKWVIPQGFVSGNAAGAMKENIHTYVTPIRRPAYTIHTLFLRLTLTLPGPSAGVSGSLDSYCSLKPLGSGMGEVVPACTSPTLPPHPLALCCHYPVSKCCSASIAMTGTVSVKSYTGSNFRLGLVEINWLAYQSVNQWSNGFSL